MEFIKSETKSILGLFFWLCHPNKEMGNSKKTVRVTGECCRWWRIPTSTKSQS